MSPATLSSRGAQSSQRWAASVDAAAEQSEQRREALIRGQLLNRDLVTIGIAQRHAPVRIQIRTRTRHILRTHIPNRIHERSDDKLRWCLRDVSVQALNGLALAGLGTVNATILKQARIHLLQLEAITGTHRLNIIRQQTELGTQGRLNATNVAECRRQVMDIDGCQRAVTVVLGTQRPAATFLLEPHTTDVPRTPRSRR